jgi:Na+-translocating ferredoxin:NAD+ oxidoreductase RnfC subunit
MAVQDFENKIRSAGIVGAGGAGFPAYAKLGGQAEYAIINGAECEPLLRVDQQLMAVRAKELLDGLSLIASNVGAKYAVIALKEKYHDAIDTLNALIPKTPDYANIRLHILGNFYPAGDEQVVVYEVTGRIVPEAGIPLAVGACVSNVETAINISAAYRSGMPVTETYLTVTGAVRNKLTVKVPVGISVAEAIELAGGATIPEYEVINGGPMMGKLTDLSAPVTKTTKGLIVLPKGHPLLMTQNKDFGRMMREARTACMHCSLCTEVCPRNMLGHRIEPHKLIRIASYGSMCDADASLTMANICVECRLCQYACVQDLQPWKLHGKLKRELKSKGIKNDYTAQPESVHPFREYKKYPVAKLVRQLGLTEYDAPAPLSELKRSFEKVCIPMAQHIGAPAVPTVAVGASVAKGDVIGQVAGGNLGCPVHASIDGKVTYVDEKVVVITA